MLDEEIKIEEATTEQEEQTNQAVDEAIKNYSLVTSSQELADQIIQAPDVKTLQQCLDIFNLNQSKKNALRALKLESLLDAVEDQAIERFQKRPDQISNKDLLDYMQVVSTQIEKSQKVADQLSVKPAIQINQQKNEVSVNLGTNLDKEGKERVIEAVNALLREAKNAKKVSDSTVIDAEIGAKTEQEDCITSEQTIKDSILVEESKPEE